MANVNNNKDQSYYDCSRVEMLEFIPLGSKKILDVGCGGGNFALLVKEKLLAEVWGLELSEQAQNEAATKLDKVVGGDCMTNLDHLPKHYFDCIVFNDILEHVADPNIVLQKAKHILNVNGVIVCSIPNVRYWYNLLELFISKDWEYKKFGILDSTHLRFFTKKSIVRMIEVNGYSIELIKGINPVKSMKYRFLNLLLFGFISDARYLQYAVTARVNSI